MHVSCWFTPKNQTVKFEDDVSNDSVVDVENKFEDDIFNSVDDVKNKFEDEPFNDSVVDLIVYWWPDTLPYLQVRKLES